MKPTETGSAFVALAGIDLELVLSEQHERVVGKDSVVSFEAVSLQLPKSTERASYARCTVTVHRVLDGTLVVTFQGRTLARFALNGASLLQAASRRKRAA